MIHPDNRKRVMWPEIAELNRQAFFGGLEPMLYVLNGIPEYSNT